jgi:hypothetical protein
MALSSFQEDVNLKQHRCEKLKSCNLKKFCGKFMPKRRKADDQEPMTHTVTAADYSVLSFSARTLRSWFQYFSAVMKMYDPASSILFLIVSIDLAMS